MPLSHDNAEQLRLFPPSFGMPRYFFHTQNGVARTDLEGLELLDVQEARIEAARAIGQLVDHNPGEFWEHGALKMTVTDHAGLVLFTLELSAT
jgi:hypothetical protein